MLPQTFVAVNRTPVAVLVSEISTFAIGLLNAALNPATPHNLSVWYAGEFNALSGWLKDLPTDVEYTALKTAWDEYCAAAGAVEQEMLNAA